MITDDHYDANYQERSSCVRCPDLWRSQSSVPEEQQYHTWLAMIRNNDVAEKNSMFQFAIHATAPHQIGHTHVDHHTMGFNPVIL